MRVPTRRSARWLQSIGAVLIVVVSMLTPAAGRQREVVVKSAGAEQTERLRIGQTMTLEGASPATLIFAGVRSDSRCPKDARCIRAGEAVVALELRQASGPASTLTFDVPPGGGATQTAGGWRVDVVSLDPQTQTDVEIAPSDYVVTVTVRPA